MVIKRLIPCLLYDGKYLVKTVNFKNPQYIGDPINAIKIFNDKEVDELVFLDIFATKQKRSPDIAKISQFTSECFMPFAYGGGITTFDDCKKLFHAGVEKVIVNSLLFTNPNEVKKVVDVYGSQAVVASIDVKKGLFKGYGVHSHVGTKVNKSIEELILFVQNELKVGEIMLTSVDNEGSWKGFDAKLIQNIHSLIKVPLIASGGAGTIEDIRKVLYELNADAAAIGSMAVYQKKGMGVLINFPKRENIIL
ncbi:imidazole glycerol phosphate synthase subunit HisF [Adhaeribacter sp. BT258]|uniref:imidazole glycerol-phosphate synthase n=1 Tax=Adhaeribacter terrigena TaxID=2793070 RepID=A0ABS1BX52_9BACT|nr:HisA/HisF-related TIM barrel protein [Adhaeribacter terrigena]MBK0401716.1 imidazole glycerol phosphate synthase subunit HisF [Adhaeribacter terrigena]